MTEHGQTMRGDDIETQSGRLSFGDVARREAFGMQLRRVREVHEESLRTFGRRIGLSPSFINKLERGEVGPPKRSTIVSIAETLHTPAAPLLLAAGYVPDSNAADDPGDLALALLFADLTEYEKAVVRGVMDALRASRPLIGG